jgi:hypothetical protein
VPLLQRLGGYAPLALFLVRSTTWLYAGGWSRCVCGTIAWLGHGGRDDGGQGRGHAPVVFLCLFGLPLLFCGVNLDFHLDCFGWRRCGQRFRFWYHVRLDAERHLERFVLWLGLSASRG